MKVIMHPGSLSGEINAVSSKSVAHRLFLCAALANVPTVINLTNVNKDITATMDCIKHLVGKLLKRERLILLRQFLQTLKNHVFITVGKVARL